MSEQTFKKIQLSILDEDIKNLICLIDSEIKRLNTEKYSHFDSMNIFDAAITYWKSLKNNLELQLK